MKKSIKKDLIILSCGGTGREIAELANGTYNILGFLDDVKSGPNIIGRLEDFPRFVGRARFCSGLGSYHSMQNRMRILEKFQIDSFITYIASNALVYASAKLGKGATVFPNSVVSSGVILKNHTLVYHNCVIAHNSTIEDYSIISNSVSISGGVKIGRNCYIGVGATLLENITIGDNCIIAAGAVALSSVESNKIYIAPKKIKNNDYL